MTAADPTAVRAGPSARRSGRDRGVRSPAFRLLWAGQGVSVLGDGIAVLVLPLLMLRHTGDPVLVGFAAAPQPVAYVLVGLVSGPLVDRRDSRRLMIWCDVLRALTFAALTWVALADRGGPAALLALALLAAVCGVLFDTAYAVCVQEVMATEALVAANSRLELTNQLWLLVGPALVGVLSPLTGLGGCLVLDAASYGVSVLTLALLPRRRAVAPRPPATARALGRELREGLRYLRSHRVVRTVSAIQTVTNFAVAAESLVVFYASRTLHAGAVTTGAVVSCAAAGGLAGAFAGSTTRWPPGRIIAVGIGGLAVALLAIAAVPSLFVLAPANALIGGCAVAATVQIRALRQRLVPHALLGRVTSAARTAAVLAYPAGVLLIGLLTRVDQGDPRPGFGLAGLLCVTSAVAAARLGRIDPDDGVPAGGGAA